jgi:hypothetical protein
MLRQIIKPKTKEQLVIRLPDEYIGKEVEVIAFDIEQNSNDNQNLRSQTFEEIEAHFNKGVLINTKNFIFNRDEANER